MNRNSKQYVIATHGTPPEVGAAQPEFLYQGANNADALLGFLDLPAGTIRDAEIETYLKAMALFNDRLFIPDGWLHCDGPVYRYLRSLLMAGEESLATPDRAPPSDYLSNTLFQLLEAGVVVPLLRGERRNPGTGVDARGWDLFAVWSGEVKDSRGSGFGVHFESDLERMAILDPTDSIAREVLRDVSRRVRVFADWTSPGVRVDAPHPSQDDRGRWDREFARSARELLAEGPLEILHTCPLIDVPGLLTEPGVVRRVRDFHQSLVAGLEPQLRAEGFRRGAVERVVAELVLNQPGLTSYQVLQERLFNGRDLLSLPAWMQTSPLLARAHPESLIGLTLLDRISTIQEHLFAKKLNAAAGLNALYSCDVLDAGLSSVRAERAPRKFNPYVATLNPHAVDIAVLTVDQILDLRYRHRAYFEALAAAQWNSDFWGTNRELLDEARAYAAAIAQAAPFNRSIMTGVEKLEGVGLNAASTGIVALAGAAKVVVKAFGVVVTCFQAGDAAESVIERHVIPGLNVTVEDLLKSAFARGRTDYILRLMGVRRLQPRADRR